MKYKTLKSDEGFKWKIPTDLTQKMNPSEVEDTIYKELVTMIKQDLYEKQERKNSGCFAFLRPAKFQRAHCEIIEESMRTDVHILFDPKKQEVCVDILCPANKNQYNYMKSVILSLYQRYLLDELLLV